MVDVACLVGVKVDLQVSVVISPHGARERRPRPLESQHALHVAALQLFPRLWVQHCRLQGVTVVMVVVITAVQSHLKHAGTVAVAVEVEDRTSHKR